jgi:hypothetical protein
MATLDIGSNCVWCNRDTSFGSGRFVNRIPVGTDPNFVEWLSDEDKAKYNEVEGYGCAECYEDCDCNDEEEEENEEL